MAENNEPQLGGATGHGFLPGRSGNPGGRSKVQRDILAALQAAGPVAQAKLIELLTCGDLKVELAAARDILDRVIGKAPDAPEDRESREDSVSALLMALAVQPKKPDT